MNMVEIVKFCDATLERVLKEFKLKIFETKFLKKASLLGELNLDKMKAYDREITKRLRHRGHVRRCESFMNGRPILPPMRRHDVESLTSGSKDEEYVIAVRDFNKFFKRRGRDLNHLIGECPKPPRDKIQRVFVRGSWSDRGEEDDEKAKDKTCLMAQASSEICLGIDLEPDEWIKDSGCSKHMTVNRKLFSSYKAYNGGNVIFGSNLRGNTIGKCTISHDSLNIANVEHVDNLGFNLLSVGQICDSK
ncbi:hypothetical protein Tco_1332966, partial [Tanacetum coccineum]